MGHITYLLVSFATVAKLIDIKKNLHKFNQGRSQVDENKIINNILKCLNYTFIIQCVTSTSFAKCV